jgi:hypothetical protein
MDIMQYGHFDKGHADFRLEKALLDNQFPSQARMICYLQVHLLSDQGAGKGRV